MWLRPTKKRYDWDNGTHLLSWLWLFWHAFRDHADPLLLWSEVRTAFMSKTWTFIVKIPSWNHSISEHTRTKFIIKCSPYIFLVFSKLKIKSKLIYISIYQFIHLFFYEPKDQNIHLKFFLQSILDNYFIHLSYLKFEI